MQIHQILPTISPGDAIGNNVLEIRKILRSWGYESDIYAEDIHSEMSQFAKTFIDYEKISSPENILIFHFAIGSNISKFVKNLPDKKIILYHNITPPDYFIGINDSLVHLLINGRKELKEFCNITDLALGVSEYNRKELIEIGFKNTGVLPIILDFDAYNQEPDQKILNQLNNNKNDNSDNNNNKNDKKMTNIIFVGRIAPHKKQEDIIKIFYYYTKINPNSRLILVGSFNGAEKYYEQLNLLLDRLKLENVYITGQINFRELISYYRIADVFISMSEHEGFCVPILESMYFDIPIIANNSSGIPYTLENSGILVNKKNYIEIAEMVNILIKDSELQKKIVRKQKERLKYFNRYDIKKIFKSYIESVINV